MGSKKTLMEAFSAGPVESPKFRRWAYFLPLGPFALAEPFFILKILVLCVLVRFFLLFMRILLVLLLLSYFTSPSLLAEMSSEDVSQSKPIKSDANMIFFLPRTISDAASSKLITKKSAYYLEGHRAVQIRNLPYAPWLCAPTGTQTMRAIPLIFWQLPTFIQWYVIIIRGTNGRIEAAVITLKSYEYPFLLIIPEDFLDLI